MSKLPLVPQSEEHSEDFLMDHVSLLMSRPAVSRPLVVTFRQTGISGARASGNDCGPVHVIAGDDMCTSVFSFLQT